MTLREPKGVESDEEADERAGIKYAIKEGLSFSQYVGDNLRYGSLRECFYNYIIARQGELPRSDEDCRDEIETGIAIFFKEENEKTSTKVELKPEDLNLSLNVEKGKVLDFDITIEHKDEHVHPLVVKLGGKEEGRELTEREWMGIVNRTSCKRPLSHMRRLYDLCHRTLSPLIRLSQHLLNRMKKIQVSQKVNMNLRKLQRKYGLPQKSAK